MFKRLGVVVVLLAAVVTLADAQPRPVRPFTFILDFLPYGEYTPYFTALDKGWYREEGLDVKILRGAGSSDEANTFSPPHMASAAVIKCAPPTVYSG